MNIRIKNMVGSQCVNMVEYELNKLGFAYATVEIGKITTSEIPSKDQIQELGIALKQSGFELVENRKNILIDEVKNVVLDMIHNSDMPLKINFSDYLSTKLSLDYTYLANIFSEYEGTSIEQFIIACKIQRVKELILVNDLNLSQISSKLHYSSVSHLSNQFKKVTGITPSAFKNLAHAVHAGF